MDHLLGTKPGVWLAVTSISFDISVLELFWTLSRGFRVIIHPSGTGTLTAGAGRSVAEQVTHHRVTHFQCTPSLLKGLLSDANTGEALRSLQYLLLGGEALPAELANSLQKMKVANLINMYGPTETTVWSTAHRVRQTGHTVPIGRPIANTQVYVLDECLQPQPPGHSGEIYIGGEGVARGYLNRPALTDEKFLPDPFNVGSGNRLYRTGDLGKWREDGSIECLGRMDNQVKIRGQRIELGEIESALLRCKGVQEAVVVAEEDERSEKRLVAYLICGTRPQPQVETLRMELKRFLNEAMLPSAFVYVDRYPLTPNGKTDRKALAKAAPQNVTPLAVFAGAGTPLENKIVQIWAELLKMDRANVGLNCNFFDLGGHSLLVVQMQGLLRERLNADLPLAKLFQYTTPRSLATYIEGGKASSMEAPVQRGLMKKKGMRNLNRPKEEIAV
jgi:acyl-coenzyme A synthetase/AMP-(fatty) acid ligase